MSLLVALVGGTEGEGVEGISFSGVKVSVSSLREWSTLGRSLKSWSWIWTAVLGTPSWGVEGALISWLEDGMTERAGQIVGELVVSQSSRTL